MAEDPLAEVIARAGVIWDTHRLAQVACTQAEFQADAVRRWLAANSPTDEDAATDDHAASLAARQWGTQFGLTDVTVAEWHAAVTAGLARREEENGG